MELACKQSCMAGARVGTLLRFYELYARRPNEEAIRERLSSERHAYLQKCGRPLPDSLYAFCSATLATCHNGPTQAEGFFMC